MVPIVSIVGTSGSGKTTLLEKLIPELKRRGYRIGTIKHAQHGFSLGAKGKDSRRHREAGADTVIVSAPGAMMLLNVAITPKSRYAVRVIGNPPSIRWLAG